MAHASDIRGAHTGLGGFAALRADIRARFEKRRIYRTTLAELSQLSDRELNDLGLHRTMLRGVAYHAAYAS